MIHAEKKDLSSAVSQNKKVMIGRKKPITKEEALQKMASLCSRGEQCSKEIREKLFHLGLRKDEIDEILNWLKSNRYIDENRYARSIAHDKSRFSNWGPNKIKLYLFSKHIPASSIKEALESVEDNIWETALMKSAETKSRQLDLTLSGEEGYNNRKKLFLFLIGRGFTSAAANRAVKIMKSRQKASDDSMV